MVKNTIEPGTVAVPAIEAQASPEASTPASPEASTPASPEASTKPAPMEGAGGKGQAIPGVTKAQRAAMFQRDTAALVTVLERLGATVKSQASKNGVFVWRVYARLANLRAERDRLSDEDKVIARAALTALESVAVLRGPWLTATFYRDSAYVGSRREAGPHHPQG